MRLGATGASIGGVTITGADDGVSVAALEAVRNEYPFVEFGVLASPTRFGGPRFPSRERLRDLLDSDLPVALHLCGRYAIDALLDGSDWREVLPDIRRVTRVQLNGFPGGNWSRVASLCLRFQWVDFVAQVRDGRGASAATRLSRAVPNLSALSDPSGGRGLPNPIERVSPNSALRVGYAGGIDPSNVVSVATSVLDLLRREGLVHPSWLDVETGVRDSLDRFDLARVRSLLGAVAHLVDRRAGLIPG